LILSNGGAPKGSVLAAKNGLEGPKSAELLLPQTTLANKPEIASDPILIFKFFRPREMGSNDYTSARDAT